MKQYFLILSVLSTCLTAGCDNYTITDKEHNCGFIRYKPVIHIIKIKKL